MARLQVAGRTAEDAVTRLADRAAERLAAPSPQPGCEPLAGTRPSLPAAASHRDLPPGFERSRSRRGSTRRQGEDAIPERTRRCDSRREYTTEARPPPALLDERDDVHYHVERLVAQHRRQGRTQFLVKWRSFPRSQNSWEFEVPLREDCPDVVDAYDLAHTLLTRHQGLRRCHQAPSASRQ
ncbi:hypothetical protein PI125_g9906 [Phytophthora idaei]|nr:hypothetical protein PI125_g9906 [Phytophthora idaei]